MDENPIVGMLWPLWILAILGMIFLAIKLWHDWLAINIYQKIVIIVTVIIIILFVIQIYL